MLRRIYIVFYAVLSALALYITGSVFTYSIESNKGFSVSFLFFTTNNSFLLMSLVLLSIIIGFVNVFIFNLDSSVKIKNSDFVDKKDKEESVEEEINQQIKNKYDHKILDIFNRITEEMGKATNPDVKLEKSLWSLCNEFELSQGLLYLKSSATDDQTLTLKSTYAYIGDLNNINTIDIGIGINGQVAKSGQFVYLKDVPNGYMKIVSGLGEISPDFLLIIPILKETKLVGLLELAGLGQLNSEEVKTIREMSQKIYSTLI